MFIVNQFESPPFTFLKTYIFHLLRQDCVTSITKLASEDSIDNKDNLDSVVSVARVAGVDRDHAKNVLSF